MKASGSAGGRKHEGEAGVERSGCWRVDGVKNKVRPVLRRGQWRATLNTKGWETLCAAPLLKSAL